MFSTVYKLGYVQDTVPKNIFEQIKFETDPKTFNFDGLRYNNSLAGNLKKEYAFIPSKALYEELLEYLKRLGNYYWAQWNTLRPELEIKNTEHYDSNGNFTKDLWVNFQSKHEYNPIHHHGGELSFVIWVNIPYSIEDEFKVFSTANSKTTGTFSFHYPDHFHVGGVNSHCLYADRTWEGQIIMFSSQLQHSVYPFYTSDEYRISVSGNLSPK